MIDLKCPNCSASISLDETREYGFCSYCGTKIQLVQKVRMMHEGTVNIGGIKTEQQQLETARKMIEIGEYSEARRLLENIVRYSPDCGEAWLELIRIKSDTPVHNLLKRKNYGDFHVCTKDNSVMDVKTYLCDMLKKSYEFNMAHKILGDNAVQYVNNLLQTGYHKIEKKFAESENIILDIENNCFKLIGYQGVDDDKREMTFFEYNNQMLLNYSSVFYDLKYIKNHNVSLQIRSVGNHAFWGPFQMNKYPSFDIVFMTKDKIYTTVGDFELGESTKEMSNEYKNMISQRQNKHLCLFCGGEISFWGKCKKHCENWFK